MTKAFDSGKRSKLQRTGEQVRAARQRAQRLLQGDSEVRAFDIGGVQRYLCGIHRKKLIAHNQRAVELPQLRDIAMSRGCEAC